ncbi:uncharacterized protein LOC128951985 [Oppia nitens]|uniref:uncharacterized protein LOC128951985 n=1 Tax=Oppia nitens TaxID=1686743 RepID=UPI0023DCE665|nr:uncharacterized protein LOC128951985 [Oppia nitens]
MKNSYLNIGLIVAVIVIVVHIHGLNGQQQQVEETTTPTSLAPGDPGQPTNTTTIITPTEGPAGDGSTVTAVGPLEESTTGPPITGPTLFPDTTAPALVTTAAPGAAATETAVTSMLPITTGAVTTTTPTTQPPPTQPPVIGVGPTNSLLQLIIKFGQLFGHLGLRFLRFINCIGLETAGNCSAEINACKSLVHKKRLINCLAAIKCKGMEANLCVHRMIDDSLSTVIDGIGAGGGGGVGSTGIYGHNSGPY